MTTRGNRRGTGPASTFTAAVHEQVRLLMTVRRMSQNKLAEATGISKNRISKTISLDEAPVTVNELELIAAALDVAPSFLLRAAEREVSNLSATPATLPQDPTRYALAAKRHEDLDVNEEDYL